MYYYYYFLMISYFSGINPGSTGFGDSINCSNKFTPKYDENTTAC